MKLSPSEQKTTIEVGKQLYDPGFFSEAAPESAQSARIVLGLLFQVYHPQSVLDIGCGQGDWLAVAEELGATRLTGVDGPWVNPAAMASRNIKFSAANLEDGFKPADKFDLCISVEVAEHLSEDRAGAFVDTLCSASDVIVFSAAIEQQGGVNHINEQKQSYWAELFAAAGYECHDFFRPRLWNDRRVARWYRQNVLLYVRHHHSFAEAARAASLCRPPLDLVHPEVYQGNLENWKRLVEEPTLKVCCQLFAKWTKRQFRKIILRRNG